MSTTSSKRKEKKRKEEEFLLDDFLSFLLLAHYIKKGFVSKVFDASPLLRALDDDDAIAFRQKGSLLFPFETLNSMKHLGFFLFFFVCVACMHPYTPNGINLSKANPVPNIL